MNKNVSKEVIDKKPKITNNKPVNGSNHIQQKNKTEGDGSPTTQHSPKGNYTNMHSAADRGILTHSFKTPMHYSSDL